MTEWRLSAAQLNEGYRARRLDPVAVARACLARMDAVNPLLNAVVARRDAGFLADAEASRDRHAQGRPLSALDGVPVTIKDNLLTRDLPTTWGSAALREHRSEEEEAPVRRLRAAGALVLGKTNVPEFTLEGYTSNPLHGVTRNPWAQSLTPGGSSGGAAASVAAGIAPLALGTDGGGSTRRPASHCGLVGLKPGPGAIARDAMLPPLLLDFEVVGTLTRSVADARLLFDVLRTPSDAAPRSAAGLRILYVERFGAHPLCPEIAWSVGEAVAALQGAGHGVTRGELPLDLGGFERWWPQVSAIGLARMFVQQPDWAAAASPRWRDVAAGAQADLLPHILEQVARLRLDCAKLFTGYDLVITPAAAALPWPADQAYPTRIDGNEVGPRGHSIYTAWVNAAGLPALALPCRPSSAGLPIGLQAIAAPGSEDLLLDFGSAYEAQLPFAQRWPTL